ncbi:hypothetical protein ABK040_015861 [Willaertia magna]
MISKLRRRVASFSTFNNHYYSLNCQHYVYPSFISNHKKLNNNNISIVGYNHYFSKYMSHQLKINSGDFDGLEDDIELQEKLTDIEERKSNGFKKNISSTYHKKQKSSKKAKSVIELSNETLNEIKELKDDAFNSTSKEIIFDVSALRTSKEIFRALNIKDYDLLQKILENEKLVNNILVNRSVDIPLNALQIAIINNDIEAVKLIFEEINKKRKRVKVYHHISWSDTGRVGDHTFGTSVKKVNVSRDGKEGLDVTFGRDANDYNNNSRNYNNNFDNDTIKRFVCEAILNCVRQPLSKEMIDLLIEKTSLAQFGELYFYALVLSGQREQ